MRRGIPVIVRAKFLWHNVVSSIELTVRNLYTVIVVKRVVQGACERSADLVVHGILRGDGECDIAETIAGVIILGARNKIVDIDRPCAGNRRVQGKRREDAQRQSAGVLAIDGAADKDVNRAVRGIPGGGVVTACIEIGRAEGAGNA